jgi:hypothetical protein
VSPYQDQGHLISDFDRSKSLEMGPGQKLGALSDQLISDSVTRPRPYLGGLVGWCRLISVGWTPYVFGNSDI